MRYLEHARDHPLLEGAGVFFFNLKKWIADEDDRDKHRNSHDAGGCVRNASAAEHDIPSGTHTARNKTDPRAGDSNTEEQATRISNVAAAIQVEQPDAQGATVEVQITRSTKW
jgi:hypothetical protein